MRHLLVTAFVHLMSLCAFGQVKIDSITRPLNKYSQRFAREKLYLHLDRQFYAPGDTLWCKAYLVKAKSNTADVVSKNIYIDLYKCTTGRLVKHLILKNEGGFSRGFIGLPDSLKAGRYEIRAYTNWMRNFPEEYFFHREIFVASALPSVSHRNTQPEIADLQFFPEGGFLVADLENRIAFKAVDKEGRGVDFKAIIRSENNDTLTFIDSQHLGMGTFSFVPGAGTRYFAEIEGSQSKKKFQLPQAMQKGYTFFVDNTSDPEFIKIEVQLSPDLKDFPLLIAQQKEKVVLAVQSKEAGNYFEWQLPKKNFVDEGIAQLTLFSGEGFPQSERIIYIPGRKQCLAALSADKADYKTREKVTLTINVNDENYKPVVGNFSLSVTDSKQLFDNPEGMTITNYLHLISDVEGAAKGNIKGFIEKPGYYFDPANEMRNEHLDILLMTQGWRKFSWPEVKDKMKIPFQYKIESGIIVRGRAELKSGQFLKKPIELNLAYYSSGDSITNLGTATDIVGNFEFTVPNVEGESKIFLQGKKDKVNGNFTLLLSDSSFPSLKPRTEYTDSLFADIIKSDQYNLVDRDSKNKLKAKTLKEVVVKARKEKVVDPRRALYSGLNVKTVEVDDSNCGAYFNVLQMLQGRVSGLMISEEPGPFGGMNYMAHVRGQRSFGISAKTADIPAIYVDGVQIPFDFITSISPCDVKSIDVITSNITMLNAPGLISILTKSPNNREWSTDLEKIPGTVVSKILGYQPPKEFYSPKYPITSSHQAENDFRATLYWNPLVKTDKDGVAKVTFYNSDRITDVHVVLEGISTNGIPTTATFDYSVK